MDAAQYEYPNVRISKNGKLALGPKEVRGWPPFAQTGEKAFENWVKVIDSAIKYQTGK